MSEAKHTPLPWHLGTDGNIWSGPTHGEQLAIVHHLGGEDSVKPDNGRLIVMSVNAHAELIAACEAFIKAANDAYDHWNNDRDSKVGKLLSAMSGDLTNYRAELTAAHAAVAKATGGTPP